MVWDIHFPLTCSAAKFQWTETVPIVSCQYRETPTDEQINVID